MNQGLERKGRKLRMGSCEVERGVAVGISWLSNCQCGLNAVENWCGWKYRIEARTQLAAAADAAHILLKLV